MMELDTRARQQKEIQQMKAALEITQDQVKTLHELFAKIQDHEEKTTRPLHNFLVRKLFALADQGIDVNQYPTEADEQERKSMKQEMEESDLAQRIYEEYLQQEHSSLIKEMKQFGEIRSRREKGFNKKI
jgi:hypothetical protein